MAELQGAALATSPLEVIYESDWTKVAQRVMVKEAVTGSAAAPFAGGPRVRRRVLVEAPQDFAARYKRSCFANRVCGREAAMKGQFVAESVLGVAVEFSVHVTVELEQSTVDMVGAPFDVTNIERASVELEKSLAAVEHEPLADAVAGEHKYLDRESNVHASVVRRLSVEAAEHDSLDIEFAECATVELERSIKADEQARLGINVSKHMAVELERNVADMVCSPVDAMYVARMTVELEQFLGSEVVQGVAVASVLDVAVEFTKHVPVELERNVADMVGASIDIASVECVPVEFEQSLVAVEHRFAAEECEALGVAYDMRVTVELESFVAQTVALEELRQAMHARDIASLLSAVF